MGTKPKQTFQLVQSPWWVLSAVSGALERSRSARRAVAVGACVAFAALLYAVWVSSLDSQKLLLEMAECNSELLGRHNVTQWLDAGPLLGAIRHGGFLPSDNSGDFDVGILSSDVPVVFALMDEIRAHCGHIIHRSETNWWPGALDTLFHIHRAAFRQFAGRYTPVFLDYKDYEDPGDGNLLDMHFVGSADAIAFPYDAVFPLWDCPFEHTTFKCPNDAELILRRTYGDDWCIPASTHTDELSERQRGVADYEDAFRAAQGIPPPPPQKDRQPSYKIANAPCPTREDRLKHGLAAAAGAQP